MTRKQYRQNVLRLYRLLPDTPHQGHNRDRAIVDQLFDDDVPFSTVEAALLLGTARRACRDPELPRLDTIRSIAYFLPILQQISTTPPPAGYLDYLRRTLNIGTPNPKNHLAAN